MSPWDLSEIVARSAAAGVNLLVATQFALLFRLGWRARLGALFAFATAFYALYSSPLIDALLSPIAPLAWILSLFNSVFFWWFATSLFDDEFHWRWWRFAPVALIAAFGFSYFLPLNAAFRALTGFGHQVVVVSMMAHAIVLALRDAKNDLIEERRRFRVVFAAVIAVVGILIAAADIAEFYAPIAPALTRLHAAALFLLSFAFAVWVLKASEPLLADPAPARVAPGAQTAAQSLRAADRPVFNRLMESMEAGVYRREGVTVASLAADVGVPEHVLRRLINRELGHRNITAFLNTWRIKDAKAALSDPANARKQILQIALDLGYGSIAPFNRAFKEATGQTPTEFRKTALGEV